METAARYARHALIKILESGVSLGGDHRGLAIAGEEQLSEALGLNPMQLEAVPLREFETTPLRDLSPIPAGRFHVGPTGWIVCGSVSLFYVDRPQENWMTDAEKTAEQRKKAQDIVDQLNRVAL
jgi:hypothetical protein